MRERIKVYRYTVIESEAGGALEQKTLLKECYCTVLQTASSNTLVAGEWDSGRDWQIQIRYDKDTLVKTNDVIEWRNFLMRVTQNVDHGEGLRDHFQNLTLKGLDE